MVQYTKTMSKKNPGTLCLYKLHKMIPGGHQKKVILAESHAYCGNGHFKSKLFEKYLPVYDICICFIVIIVPCILRREVSVIKSLSKLADLWAEPLPQNLGFPGWISLLKNLPLQRIICLW